MFKLLSDKLPSNELPTNEFYKTPNVWMLYKFSTSNQTTKLLLMEIGVGLQHLKEILSEKEVCYIIMNYQYTSPTDGVKRTRPLFISWAPEQAPVREKFKISSYLRDIRYALLGNNGSALDIQANDMSDLSNYEILSKIRNKTTHF